MRWPLLFLFLLPLEAWPQARHQGELWTGYIGSVRFSDRFSIWHDHHFVTGSFFITRYGLMYHRDRLQIAGGNAWLWTATAFTDQLVRGEIRPWGQVLWQTRLREGLAASFRFRYDARFRQRIRGEELLDELMFNHRLRFMVRLRQDLRTYPNGDVLHVNLMDEILFNAGRQVNNGIDQNRAYALLGYTHKGYTLLAGYHVRMFPTAIPTYNHGLTIWFLHTLDIRDRLKRLTEPEPLPMPHMR
jgi:hypothetical protein